MTQSVLYVQLQGVAVAARACTACRRWLSVPITIWTVSAWCGASCGLSLQHSLWAPAAIQTGVNGPQHQL